MEHLRKPFQGIGNIVRFNWHFYVLAFGSISVLFLMSALYAGTFRPYLNAFLIVIVISVLISLLVSYYIYDRSELYRLSWLDGLHLPEKGKIVTINAGFDETSMLLENKFKASELMVLDFYDPEKHTEVSVKRARKAYPPYLAAQRISTIELPLLNNEADTVFVLLSAHEIRNSTERIQFFKELHRVLKPSGRIIITEHLRDFPNFLAYTIGFFHFYSGKSWRNTFREAGLSVKKELKITPFITTFVLTKHGTSS